jgi:Holliday junction resolvase RusA-like endonuclease
VKRGNLRYSEEQFRAHAGRGGASGAVVDTDATPQPSLLPPREVHFTLPMPPSVNALYHGPTDDMVKRGVDRRAKFLTEEQRAFRRQVVDIVRVVMLRSGGVPLAGRLSMRLRIVVANRRRMDVSNRVKAVEDALTHAKAYGDDSQIDQLIVQRVLDDVPEHCTVELRELA